MIEYKGIIFSNVDDLIEYQQKTNYSEPEPIKPKIEELDLSVRSYRALKRYGIDYVYQIVELPRDEFQKIRNFGKKCFKELKEKLLGWGITI